jgi:hypothetical protein
MPIRDPDSVAGDRRPAADHRRRRDRAAHSARRARSVLSRHTYETQARLWRNGTVVSEETRSLHENLYFAPELLLLLDLAGFRDVRMEAAYEGRPATPADDTVIVVARPTMGSADLVAE